jgi:NadR type nicotinamide-nucleotide adenylyltransferase
MEKKYEMQKRVVVIGPESTGKSTLCMNLALHYKTKWLPEYARTYIENLNRPYTNVDVLHIAKKQIELEKELAKENQLIFIDTDLIITKVWLLHVYKTCPKWIDDAIKNTPRTLYLLCYHDLPWEFDPVRENPQLRDYFFEWYKKEIEALNIPYIVVKGEGDMRLKDCIQKISNAAIII